MKFKAIARLYDHQRAGSVTAKLRQKRLAMLIHLLGQLPIPVRVLDVGGTEDFWLAFPDRAGIKVTILNIDPPSAPSGAFEWVIGDARSMTMFADKSYDVVVSNAVIEHVGTLEDQRRMAKEVGRVGRRVFLQAPHRYFPIEPHFLYPFLQFMPHRIQVWLICHASLTWRWPDRQVVSGYVRQIRLPTKKELRAWFPQAEIVDERLAGMTKSFLVLEGWH